MPRTIAPVTPVKLSPGSYFGIAVLVQEDLLVPMPEPVYFDDGVPLLPDDISIAVYVAFDPDWNTAYVGSVWRPNDSHGIESRIMEHLRERDKNARWRGMYLLPLKPSTTDSQVRQAEGRIGRALRPYMTQRLPR